MNCLNEVYRYFKYLQNYEQLKNETMNNSNFIKYFYNHKCYLDNMNDWFYYYLYMNEELNEMKF